MGVGVSVDLLAIGDGQDGVDGQEPSGGGVVGAGADVDQAGGVVDAADESLLAGPGLGGGAAGVAVGVHAAYLLHRGEGVD